MASAAVFSLETASTSFNIYFLQPHFSICALRVAATSLLTRKVRLPIPSMAQLDAARSFGSAFEQQKLGDQFRVP
jgi:hypothetical protein